MACIKVDSRRTAISYVLFGVVLPKPYATEQECDDECGDVGACCTGNTCTQVRACMCAAPNSNNKFLGIGVPCNPNPCNPLP